MEKLWLKNYPPGIPAELPPSDQSLIQRFERACEEFQNQTAFSSFGQNLSYKELKERSLHFAGYLQSQGFKKGDVLVIQLPNLLQYPLSLWAGILSGLTVVNMNPLSTSREMLGPIQETEAKGILLLSSQLNNLREIYGKTKLKTVIVTDPGDLLAFPKKQIINFVFKSKNLSFQKSRQNSSFKPISFLKALQKGRAFPVRVQEKALNETLFIQYTGGTTGIAKGACLSQKNILSNVRQCESWMLTYLRKGKEQALSALPLCHIFAFLVNGLVFFLNGFSNILIANPRNIPSLVKTIRRQKLTVGTGVNALFKALLKNPQFQKMDFSKWRLFISGGTALESSVQKKWETLTQSRLIEGYGLTEASPVVTCSRLDKESIPGSAGYPLSSTQIRIVDEKGSELKVGEEGELEVKGPQVMKAYYRQEEESRKVFRDGWLKTGDIAKVSPEGWLKIIDRKKDMINISGLKVYPIEVEEVLLSCDKVEEAVVVPGKNSEGEEIVQAFVVRSEGLSEGELKSFCTKYLSPYKRPKRIAFVKNLPKSFAGKPLRRLFKNSS